MLGSFWDKVGIMLGSCWDTCGGQFVVYVCFFFVHRPPAFDRFMPSLFCLVSPMFFFMWLLYLTVSFRPYRVSAKRRSAVSVTIIVADVELRDRTLSWDWKRIDPTEGDNP